MFPPFSKNYELKNLPWKKNFENAKKVFSTVSGNSSRKPLENMENASLSNGKLVNIEN